MTFDALAAFSAQQTFLKALTIFFDAERFSAGAAFDDFDSIHSDVLCGSVVAQGSVHFNIRAVFLVVAVSAPTQLVALYPCSEALAIELHAFRVAAIAELLLGWFLDLLE